MLERDNLLDQYSPSSTERPTTFAQYQPPATHTRVIASFPADQVREDSVDRSRGRGRN